MKAYWWFCLEHVRLYNAHWNYYAGMSETEIEADIRFDTVWQRPTWRLGTLSGSGPHIHDPFHSMGGKSTKPRQANGREAHACAVLELEPPVTMTEVKARYKILVKRHHPDVTGGDKVSEERFKEISEAYRTLMKFLRP